MLKHILKGLWIWILANLESIIGGFVVALPIELTLLVLTEPDSIGKHAILAGTAAILGILTGCILSYLKGIKRIILTSPLGVYRDQSSSDLSVLLFIAEHRPHKAKLLEYASSTIHGIISNLATVDCEIQLLLQHPQYAVNADECRRICAQIKAYSGEMADYQHLRIRCYRERASLRGRNFDNRLIHLGWLTYHINSPSEPENVYGHTNPLIYSDSERKEFFQPLSEWFDKVFDQYWYNADSLERVNTDCEELGKLNIPQSWLRIVSQ